MATAEAAHASLGPRYAPDDPTLPKPWKGIIDGTTGLLYYWNPETNITQYEKPTAVPPPLPQGPPPVTPTPKLAPIPGAQVVQPNGVTQQQGQQMTQTPQQQGQQHSTQLVQTGLLQQGLQAGPAMQHQGQLTAHHLRPQMMHQPNQQMFPQPEHQMGAAQQGSQIPQRPMQQQASQQAQMPQGTQMGPPQAYQFAHQHMQHMAYQQNMPQQGQQSSLQQTQPTPGQQFSHQQDHNKLGFAQREDPDFQRGHQIGFSPSQGQQGQQAGVPSFQNPPAGKNSGQMPQAGVQSAQASQFGSVSVNMQQPTSFAKSLQSGGDLSQQQCGPMFQNQMGPGPMHGRPSDVSFAGLKAGYEENTQGRAGNEYYSNANKDGSMGVPQQPKLAAIPVPRNQQELRMGNLPSQHSSGYPGGLNPVAGPPMQNMYSHAAGAPPFPNNALMRPPGMMGSPDDDNPVEAYRRKHEVTATGHNVPDPFMSFEATGFPQEILREIHSAGFAAPTPIQAQTWPIALQNRDIVAIAKTGSGKTLGYLIPAFMLLRHLRNNPLNGPTVVVLAPTRELATQIQDEAIKFGRSSRVSCTCLYGGAPKALQLKELDRGADIVVATPGRLNDILEMKKVDFRQVSLLVLDEADRMLDMGFEPQIRKIVNEIPPRRQTLMYTATWPKEVRKIAGDLLVNPVQVNIGNVDELAANKSITQHVEVVHQAAKERRLEQILRSQERGSKIIIFCATKRLCDQLTRTVGRSFGAAAIHGDKNQSERDWVLSQFRSGKSPILVATDVAARGLDIKDIRVVVNYDFPTGVEDYVHRIGRTGRAGATGVAYTFFSEQDWKYAADLIKVLEGANQIVPQELRDIASRGASGFSKDRSGMTRFDSGGDGGERWDSGGVRDGGFGGRGGMRDGNFGGRDGMRDGNFGGRGGMRDGGFGGRGGMRDGGFGGRGDMRDGGFGGRGDMRDGGYGGRGGMRDGGYGGRGGMRDGGYGGRGGPRGGGFGGNVGFERNDRRPYDRHNNMDTRGRGRGRGGGRFDNRRDGGDRSRGRNYSSSPERVRTWGGYSRSRSRSRSNSRSRSRSYSRSRSWSRSRSPRRSRSPTPARRVRRRESKFDQMEPQVAVPPESGVPASAPAIINKTVSGAEPVDQSPLVESSDPPQPQTTADPSNPVTEP